MNKDQAKGKLKKGTGEVQEAFGDARELAGDDRSKLFWLIPAAALVLAIVGWALLRR